MGGNIFLWVGFNLFIVFALLIDIYVFNKKPHELKIKEALVLTGFWVSLAIIFGLGVYLKWGSEYALEFATGYVIEQSLSIDNLFVILLLFTFFKTPPAYQQKVLIWGILGAIFFRIVFILTGITLINNFQFAIYILGIFLIFSSINMLFDSESNVNPDKNIVIRIFRKIMPVTESFHDGKFFIRQNKVLSATPLFITLIVIETTDIVFAIDSIPAIIAVSHHSFIIYTSNIFAVLGLRSLYFALAGLMKLFHFLKYGLSVILIFIGAKILLTKVLISNNIHIDIKYDLLIIGSIIALSVFISILSPQKVEAQNEE